jgi:hypothetical protein
MKLTALCIAAAVAATAVLVPVPALAGETTEARANQLPLRFKDANGKVVGRAAWGNLYAYPFIIMQENKQIFAIRAFGYPTQLRFAGDAAFYKTADCSGQAYLNLANESSLQGLRFATVLSSGDGQLSILVSQGIPAWLEMQSVRYVDSACLVDDPKILGVPVTDTIDISGKYQPPFSIR